MRRSDGIKSANCTAMHGLCLSTSTGVTLRTPPPQHTPAWYCESVNYDAKCFETLLQSCLIGFGGVRRPQCGCDVHGYSSRTLLQTRGSAAGEQRHWHCCRGACAETCTCREVAAVPACSLRLHMHSRIEVWLSFAVLAGDRPDSRVGR